MDMGGGGGGGGAPANSSTTVQNYSPEEVQRRNKVQDAAGQIYEATKGQFSQYPGAKVIAPSNSTLTAESMLQSLVPVGQSMAGNLSDATKFGLTGAVDVQNNPYFRSAVDASIRPMVQQFTDSGGVLSQLRDGATAAGQYGGSRQGIAEGIATGRLAQAVGDTVGKMGSEAYGKGLDTMSNTIKAAPASMLAMSMPTQWQSSLGQIIDTRNQATENQAAAERTWALNKDWIPLQNYANMVYGAGSSQSTTNATSPVYTPNQGGGMLNTLGTLAGIGGSIAGMSAAGF